MTIDEDIRATDPDPVPVNKQAKRLGGRLPVEELNRDGRLRRWVWPNGVTGYMTTTAEQFRAALLDPRLHAKRFLGEPQPTSVSVAVPDMPGFIPSMNGPEHLAVRRLAAGHFSVKHVQKLGPMIDEVVEKYLDEVEAAGSPSDLFAQYCLPIPSEVIARILGVPTSHTPEFQDAARYTIGGLPDRLPDPDLPARAVKTLHELLAEVIAMKRAEPQDDLITQLTQATDPELSDEEIWGLCTNLLLAGHETTASNSAYQIAFMLTWPEVREKVMSNPDRVPEYIEEMLRFRAILTDSGAGIPRLVTEDMEFAGVQLKKGEWVMPCAATANVDPEVCKDGPTELRLDREPFAHLTFGYGAHTCLGQHLARAELKVIVPKVFERFPNLELQMPIEEVPWLDQGFGYRMAELPVTW